MPPKIRSMKRVTLVFVRESTGSVVRIEMEKPVDAQPFAPVKGFDGFKIKSGHIRRVE